MSNSTTPPGPTDRLARARAALAAAEAQASAETQAPDGSEFAEPATPVLPTADQGAPDDAAGDDMEVPAAVRGDDIEVPAAVRGDDEPDPHHVARQIALRQLSMAPRSRQQLADKLRQKGCADEVAREVLDRLEQVGLVDDLAYAHMLVRNRQETKGLAPRALSQELRRKGVADDIIDAALADVEPEDAQGRARELVEKRLRTMRGLDREVQMRRLAGFLGRKGYDSNVAFRVINEALEELPEHQRD